MALLRTSSPLTIVTFKVIFPSMEKPIPHFPLSAVKALVRSGRVHITVTAQKSANAMGLCRQDVCDALLHITSKEFHKSMTAYADASVWQDVYRHKAVVGILYVKLTVIDDVVVLSFKEL